MILAHVTGWPGGQEEILCEGCFDNCTAWVRESRLHMGLAGSTEDPQEPHAEKAPVRCVLEPGSPQGLAVVLLSSLGTRMTFLCQRLALGKGPERGLVRPGLQPDGLCSHWSLCSVAGLLDVEINLFLQEPGFVRVCLLLGFVWHITGAQ